jgi:type II secretory pathway pseudopilin PulG
VSLLEIIIAMQITALLLALLCRVLPLARRQVRDTNLKMERSILAQNVMEEYLVVSPEKWPNEPFRQDGYEVHLSTEPWPEDSRLQLMTVSLKAGTDEQYRLETLVEAL